MAVVLVVDDEFGIANLVDAVLTDEGHRVLIAANGQQGYDHAARERPDLVFLDYMMPVMDGAGMLSAMNEDPTLRAIPVVLMSSMPEAAIAARCQNYVAFLRKPFRIREILSLTSRLLDEKPQD